jgi:hypothetical protein
MEESRVTEERARRLNLSLVIAAITAVVLGLNALIMVMR